MNQPTAPASSTDLEKNLRNMPTALWVGLGTGLVAFVIRFGTSSTKTVNGVMTECSYIDLFALAAAVVCGVSAVLGLVHGLRAPRERFLHPAVLGAVALLVLVLGGIHVFRGLGMIGGPC